VIKGRDRGKQAQVQKAFPKQGEVLVEGINVVMRHTKSTPNVRQAGIIQKELPMNAANVMLICTHCNQPTRVGTRTLADDTKTRICNRCKEVIE
jgi:large subunit ribosomal protein L24